VWAQWNGRRAWYGKESGLWQVMAEWRNTLRWGWRWVVLVVALSSAAYLFAYLFPPEGQVFLGFLANNDDSQLYLSYMREGADGRWLVRVHSTAEAHDPALLLPLYPLLGKVARILGLSNELVFHLSRLLAGVALLFAVSWLCSLCFSGETPQRSAFLLVVLSSGFGWLLVVSRLADTAVIPVDIRMPEANTFLTIFASPHFALGVALEVLCFASYLVAGRHSGYVVLSAISLLLLSVTLVYSVIVVAATLLVYSVLSAIRMPRAAGRTLVRSIMVGLPSVPVVVYYYLLLDADPFWHAVYRVRLVFPTPNPFALTAGYGLVLWLALWGLVQWFRSRQWSAPRALVSCWAVVNGLLVYGPFSFQGRLMAGWHVALCILAAAGLHDGFLPWVKRQARFAKMASQLPRALSTVRNVVLILTVPSTLLVALLGLRIALEEHYYPYYLPDADVRAVDWLASQTDGNAVLLSSYGIGNYWVGHSAGRAVLGHQYAVVAPLVKAQAVRRFFSGEADEQEMRALSRSLEATCVFFGTLERGLGTLDLDGISWLHPIYGEDGVAIYRIDPDDRPTVGGGG
jgi:hypothetical protein